MANLLTLDKGSNLNTVLNNYLKNKNVSSIITVSELFSKVLGLNPDQETMLLKCYTKGAKIPYTTVINVPSYNKYNSTVLNEISYYKYENTKVSGIKRLDKKLSYFNRVTGNDIEKYRCYLPVIPEEFSETNSAIFNPVSLMGRSVDYQIYTGSSREVSFTLKLHQEIFTLGFGLNNIYNIVNLIESSCYPYYTNIGWAGPPQVVFKIGQQFYIKGILTGCNVTWHLPLDSNGRYTNCDLSISVKETNGPYGAYDIYKDSDSNTGLGLGSYRSSNP